MPQYKVLEKSLIGNEIYEEGAIVEYDGYPSGNLEPLCDEGRAKAAELVQINAERIKQMKLENPDTPTIDTDAFAKAVASAIAEANAQFAAQNQAILEALANLGAAKK